MKCEYSNGATHFQFENEHSQAHLASTPFYRDGEIAEYSFDFVIEEDEGTSTAFFNISIEDAERIAIHLLSHRNPCAERT